MDKKKKKLVPGELMITIEDEITGGSSPMFATADLSLGANGYTIGSFVFGVVIARIKRFGHKDLYSLYVLDSASGHTGWVYSQSVRRP